MKEAKHVMTVGELMKELARQPAQAEVRIASSMFDSHLIASIYPADANDIVWLDIH